MTSVPPRADRLGGLRPAAAVDLDLARARRGRATPRAGPSFAAATSAMNDWPPNPGSTVITRTMSSRSRYASSAASGVAGLTDSPADRPAARMRSRAGRICGASTSTWNVIESQPASRNSSVQRPGSAIIRWASNGSAVTARTASMVFQPNVRFGTKWPSITSRWIRSAPASSARRISSPSAARFESRMLAAIRTPAGRRDAGRHSPTPAGTGSSLRSPRRAAALSRHQPLAAALDDDRRGLARMLRGELAAGGADLHAPVAADRRGDAGRPEARREPLDDGHRRARSTACARPGSSGSGSRAHDRPAGGSRARRRPGPCR